MIPSARIFIEVEIGFDQIAICLIHVTCSRDRRPDPQECNGAEGLPASKVQYYFHLTQQSAYTEVCSQRAGYTGRPCGPIEMHHSLQHGRHTRVGDNNVVARPGTGSANEPNLRTVKAERNGVVGGQKVAASYHHTRSRLLERDRDARTDAHITSVCL